MKQSLQLRLSQHLALTPQLQQSIRLLQLSTLELNQEIEQALQDNPLLEREEVVEAAAFSASGDAMSQVQTTSRGAAAREVDDSAELGWGSEMPSGQGSRDPATMTSMPARSRPRPPACAST